MCLALPMQVVAILGGSDALLDPQVALGDSDGLRNEIRLEMAEVAREAKVAPTELSFIRALHYLQHEWSWFAVTASGKLPQHLQLLRRKLATALLPQTRRGRECPRVVKALPRRYAEKKVGKP